jgi:hypothetical protein
MRAFGALREKLQTLCSDTSGSTAVIAAIAFPLMIGGAGLGAEVGYWYLTERKLQHAADVSAYAAALRLENGQDEQATLDRIALHIATQSGFRNAGGSVWEVNHPWVDSEGVSRPDYIEVTLVEKIKPLFSGLFGGDVVEVRGSAVARLSGRASACVLALSATANNALRAGGSTDVDFEDCVAASNSSSNSAVQLSGSANFTASCIHSHGNYVQSGSSDVELTDCAEIKVNSAIVPDPYSSVQSPVVPAGVTCPNATLSDQAVATTGALPNGVRYRCFNSLTLKQTITLESNAVYIVRGDLKVNGNTTITGSGVTFAVGGNVDLTGNVTMRLSAPTAASNPYRGLLFFGDRDAAVEAHKISGNSGSFYQGAIYFPSSDLRFTGSSALVGGCTQIIANTIEFTGSSGIRSSCESAGVTRIAVTGSGGSVQLYE